jgi:hypothetical protein
LFDTPMKWFRVLFGIVVVAVASAQPATAQVFPDLDIDLAASLVGASIANAEAPVAPFFLETFGDGPANGPRDPLLELFGISVVSLNNTNTTTLADNFFPALADELNMQAVEPGTASYLQTVSNIHASAVHLNFDPFTLGATEYFEVAWLRDVDGLPSFEPGDGVPGFLPGHAEFTAISFSGGEHRANIGRVVGGGITNYANSEPILFAPSSDGAWFVNVSPREATAIAITHVTGSDVGTARSLVVENLVSTEFSANDPASVALLPTAADILSPGAFGVGVEPPPATTEAAAPATTLAAVPATTLAAVPATTEPAAPATTLAAAPATTLAPTDASTGSSTDGESPSNAGLLIGGGIGAAVAIGIGATVATKKRKGTASVTGGDGGAVTVEPEPRFRGYEAPFDSRDAPYEIAARRQMVERARELGSTPDAEGFISVPQSVVLEFTLGFADDPDLTAPRTPDEAAQMEAEEKQRPHRTRAASGAALRLFSEPGRRFRIHPDDFEMDTWIKVNKTADEPTPGPDPETGETMLGSTTDEITNL